MQSNYIFTLARVWHTPWKLKDQRLELDKNPYEPHLRIEAKRGSTYPCPECGASRKAHDFAERTLCHLNFFSTTAPLEDIVKST